MGFLWGGGLTGITTDALVLGCHTIVSVEQSQTNTPNALASHHLVFPPLAATEADNKRSWLSLWKAQIMSLYRNLSLRPREGPEVFVVATDLTET